MIDFVVASSDLQPHVLDTQVKRGAVDRPLPGSELAPVVREDAGGEGECREDAWQSPRAEEP